MEVRASEFERLASDVVTRFLAQNDHDVSAEAVRKLAKDLRQRVRAHGLPSPRAANETGEPRALTEAELAALLEPLLREISEPSLADAAKQLVKTCFYPELATCRDSYRERGRDGVCRRQELARARGRVSGAHCVDCPHWTALAPDAHARLLEQAWCRDPAEFRAHRDVFLPEAFRLLRRWLHDAARRGVIWD